MPRYTKKSSFLGVMIFDLDGVVIKKDKVFSIRFSEKYSIPLDKILEFFKTEFQECLVGKKDLKKILPFWLEKWGVNISVDDVLHFWFSNEAKIDEKVAREIRKIKSKGIKTYAVTNNEIYRVQYLKENTKVNELFDEIIASGEVGFKKPEVEFYKWIERKIKISDPATIWYWDDDIENVEGAHKAGWRARLFTNIGDL